MASGKSTIADFLAKDYKYHIINADQISKQLLAKPAIADFIRAELPEKWKNINFNSKLFRNLIFFNKKFNFIIKKIFWPIVKMEIIQQLKAVQNQNVVIETLDNTTCEDINHSKWYVQNPHLQTIHERISAKYPDLTTNQINNLLNIQSELIGMSYNSEFKLINNDDTIKKLNEKIRKLAKL